MMTSRPEAEGAGRIALFSAGDMGHAVGAVCVERGLEVATALAGRSDATRHRAQRAGIEDAGSLEGALAGADLILSIMPPARAEAFAEGAAEWIAGQNAKPHFADCNAVSPETARRMQQKLEAAGAHFIDAGIVGPPPGRSPQGPRFYASGVHAAQLKAIEGSSERGSIRVQLLGDEVGKASGLKMVYAGLTKGTMTLHAAVLVTAQRLGLLGDLSAELQDSQPEAWKRMGILPFLPADAERWVGEMEQIAETFRSAGAPGGFHDGAADIFRIMAETPFASETRETLDRSRSLEEAIEAFARVAAARRESD
jgi:3-hydroxyisobutyrate dehydrogenase-like beta-hydroxyacid dehydrogenase